MLALKVQGWRVQMRRKRSARQGMGLRLPGRILVTGLLLSGPAWSAAPTIAGEPSAAAIRNVINTQLRAFARNDATTAFAQAAPAIRVRFGSAGRFLAMVRKRYLPIYRSRAAKFGRFKIMRNAPVQEVFLVGQARKLWRAFYRMERQPDGGWKILGVWLLRPKGRSL
jgi:hypothetical protein